MRPTHSFLAGRGFPDPERLDQMMRLTGGALYKLNETSGTTAAATDPAYPDGTYRNTPLLGQAGPWGAHYLPNYGVAQFRSSPESEYMDTPDDADWDATTIATWAALVRIDSWSSINQQMISRDDVGGSRCFQFRVGNGPPGSSNRFPRIVVFKGGSNQVATSSVALAVGTWAMVVASMNDTLLRMYVNGVQRASVAIASGSMDAGSIGLSVGRLVGGADQADMTLGNVLFAPGFFATADNALAWARAARVA